MPNATPIPVEIPVSPYDALGVVAKHWHQELTLIQGAPILTVATALILAALAYLLNRAYFRSTISGLREHVGSLEAHKGFLADKLANAERQAGALAGELPTEFKDKIRHLEESLLEMRERAPRTITDQQRTRFRKAIEGVTLTQTVGIYSNSLDLECEGYGRLLIQMFRDSGWNAGGGVMVQEALPSNEGLLLVVANPENLTPDQQKVSKALSESGLTHKVVKSLRNLPPNAEQFYLLVGSEKHAEN